jgi:hypothetical protein
MIEWFDERWVGKDLEGNGCVLIGISHRYFPGRTEKKPRGTIVRISRGLAEILSEHPPNTNLKCYRYSNLLCTWLMLFWATIAVDCENYVKPTVWAKCRGFNAETGGSYEIIALASTGSALEPVLSKCNPFHRYMICFSKARIYQIWSPRLQGPWYNLSL